MFLADWVGFAVFALKRMVFILVMGLMFPFVIARGFPKLCVAMHMPVDSICRLVNVARISTLEGGIGIGLDLLLIPLHRLTIHFTQSLQSHFDISH